jgi:2'-5' RNA ligase
MRTFIAISLPEEILRNIEVWIQRLRQLDIHARFPRLTSIHLTLKFLGEIEESRLNSVVQAVDFATAYCQQFELTAGKLGTFPSIRNPRVVWLGISRNEILSSLQRALEDQLFQCNFSREDKLFRPHLTLARVKSKRGLDNLRDFLEKEGEMANAGSFTVREIHTFQSILRPSGAEYKCLHTHPLRVE